jgi:hypothetical protein
MKTFLALAALSGLAACSGTTTVGADGGTGGTVAVTPVACTDCIAQTVGWGANGGLVTYTEDSSLTSCRTYTHTRTPVQPPGSPTSCTLDVGGCDAGPVAIHDVEQALAHPDVIAALAGSVPVYGTDPRPCDGTVTAITVGGKTLYVGGDCATGQGCFAGASCVPTPAGVQALVDVLGSLDQQALKLAPCAGAFQ